MSNSNMNKKQSKTRELLYFLIYGNDQPNSGIGRLDQYLRFVQDSQILYHSTGLREMYSGVWS
jgi:hypothetical protein